MCGIVGLHLREPSLYPRLGELLTGMLCQVTERGPDSAGVAVYGDPRWSPPGHASVSLLPGTTTPDEVATALRAEVPDVAVVDAGQTLVVHAPIAVDTLVDHGRTGEATVVVGPADASFLRCERIEVTVALEVPAIRLPFAGGFGDSFDVQATRSELIDPTRSGVGGLATCVQ